MAKKKKPKTGNCAKREPSVTIKDINEIRSTAPGVIGPTPLHPNFVEARRATQFQPGQSGNPGGRPKPIIRDLILKQGLTVHDRDVYQRTYFAILVDALFRGGFRGSVPAAKELFDRTDGPSSSLYSGKETQDGKLDQIISAMQNPIYDIARELGIDGNEFMTKAVEYATKAFADKVRENADGPPAAEDVSPAEDISKEIGIDPIEP